MERDFAHQFEEKPKDERLPRSRSAWWRSWRWKQGRRPFVLPFVLGGKRGTKLLLLGVLEREKSERKRVRRH